MNRSFAIFLAIALGLLSVGCSPQAKTNAKSDPQAQREPAWKLTLHTHCADSNDDECVGFYGFTIMADGHFQVGPTDRGKLARGVVSSEDLALVQQALLKGPIGGGTANSENCSSVNNDGREYALVLTRQGQERSVFHQSSSQLCFQTATVEHAQALQKAVLALADRYYPQPFPDKCLEAAEHLASYHASLQDCRQDSDCSYVNSFSFEPVEPGADRYLQTDNCTVATPLVVANRALLLRSQSQLANELEQVKEICGRRLTRPSCTQARGFATHGIQPVCQAGRCRAAGAATVAAY